MVAPVTAGPTGQTLMFASFNGHNVVVYEKDILQTQRQKKPYNLWLLKQMDVLQVTSFFSTRTTDYPQISSYQPLDQAAVNFAYGKALAKLKDDIQESSLWSVNIKEYKESFELITKDAATLFKASKQISRFDFFGAARTLKTYVPKGLKAKAKSFGDNFLKFHFGIDPLMQDIGSAVELLQRAVPNRVVRGTGKSVRSYDNNIFYPPYAADLQHNEIDSRCHLQVEIRCNSPNLYLANQLGFVNPAAFAWEVIPFSFVVDWFANVGQFLDQFSMFAGLDIIQVSNSYLQRNSRLTKSYNNRSDFPWVPYHQDYTVRSVWNKRSGSLPVVALEVYPWKAPSPVRAATAISLLVQHLKS
jgi:hypothetical protein